MNSYQQGAPYHDTNSKVIGYLLWILGFTGSHRFYYGKPITGVDYAAERTAERDRLWALSEDLLLTADFNGQLLRVSPSWSRGLGCVINSQGIMQSPVVREHAGIADDQVIMKSIALGWPDETFPANAVVSERKSVAEAATFVGFE